MTASLNTQMQAAVLESAGSIRIASRPVPELKPGMVIGRDLKTAENVVLLAIGQVLSTGLIQRIQRFEEREGTPVTLWVRGSAAPAKAPAKATSAAR